MGSEGRNRHLTDSIFVGLFREAYISTRSKDYDRSLQCVYICTNYGRRWKVQIKLICGIHSYVVFLTLFMGNYFIRISLLPTADQRKFTQ